LTAGHRRLRFFASTEVTVSLPRPRALLVLALLASPLPAAACGEGMFNTGKGLPYQAYLAPRPAAVLVYSDPSGAGDAGKQASLYAGLQKAGHQVTVVHDAQALERAIADRHFDVVISDFARVDAVDASTAAAANRPAVVPVVARSARNSAQVRDRFDLFVLDGASLGQYLRAINQAVGLRR
jgi:CheY-like chemotaxis protein